MANHIHFNPHIKELTGCAVGDLIIYEDITHGRIMAIAVENGSDIAYLVIYCANLDDSPIPFLLFSLNGPNTCISYGNKWVIEPTVDNESQPSHRKGNFPSGGEVIASVSAFGIHVRSNGYKSQNIDLDTFKIIDFNYSECASFKTWLVWESDEARRTQGSEPIFCFPPVTGQQSENG